MQAKEEKEEGAADAGGPEAAAEAEAILAKRVVALVDTTSCTVFSYICQACSPCCDHSTSLAAAAP